MVQEAILEVHLFQYLCMKRIVHLKRLFVFLNFKKGGIVSNRLPELCIKIHHKQQSYCQMIYIF